MRFCERADRPVKSRTRSGALQRPGSIANLECFHFRHLRHSIHRRPDAPHAHFFSTTVRRNAAGVGMARGEEFEIQAPAFGKPSNGVERMPDEGLVTVMPL